MLSHNIASKDANKDDGQTMGVGGGGRSGGRNTSTLRPPEQIAKCPRCDSSNTKFCYYNNYSLAQPRHFCKACKRYWTKGGALRNVPIGGSCKKKKKTKSCSSGFFPGESCSKFSSYDIAGMKVLGPSTLDFQLGGLNILPRVTSPNYQFTSSNQYSLVNLDPLGYNLPFSSSHIVMKQEHNQNGGEFGSFNEKGTTTSTNHIHHINNDLATSIESLSSINQDLHWKLQQQRLGMLFGGENDEQQQQNKQVVLETDHDHDQKLQPILFQNLETSKPVQSSMDGDHSRKETGSGCGLATEWFFDNGYAPVINPNRATSSNRSGAGNDQNGSMNNWNINGIQDWNDRSFE